MTTTAATTAGGAGRPLRADARRNRDRLLAVATEALRDDVEIPLETIAERAGVGIGTLYCHFPHRDALIEAAYRHEVEELCDAAPVLLATAPDAITALREWADRFVGYVATKRGLAGALRTALGSDTTLFTETRDRITGALNLLLEACRAEGSVRADIEASDVLLTLGGVWTVPDGPQWESQVRRVLDLVVGGLRYGA